MPVSMPRGICARNNSSRKSTEMPKNHRKCNWLCIDERRRVHALFWRHDSRHDEDPVHWDDIRIEACEVAHRRDGMKKSRSDPHWKMRRCSSGNTGRLLITSRIQSAKDEVIALDESHQYHCCVRGFVLWALEYKWKMSSDRVYTLCEMIACLPDIWSIQINATVGFWQVGLVQIIIFSLEAYVIYVCVWGW